MIRSLLIALIPVAALTANTMAGTNDLAGSKAQSADAKIQALNAFADELLTGPSMVELKGGMKFSGGNFCKPHCSPSYCKPYCKPYCAPYCPTYTQPYCQPYVQSYCEPVSYQYTDYCFSQPEPCYTPCYTDYCEFSYCEPVICKPVVYCKPVLHCAPTYCAPTYCTTNYCAPSSYCSPSNYCFPKSHCLPIAKFSGKNIHR